MGICATITLIITNRHATRFKKPPPSPNLGSTSGSCGNLDTPYVDIDKFPQYLGTYIAFCLIYRACHFIIKGMHPPPSGTRSASNPTACGISVSRSVIGWYTRNMHQRCTNAVIRQERYDADSDSDSDTDMDAQRLALGLGAASLPVVRCVHGGCLDPR
jgi:hypothetical protein